MLCLVILYFLQLNPVYCSCFTYFLKIIFTNMYLKVLQNISFWINSQQLYWTRSSILAAFCLKLSCIDRREIWRNLPVISSEEKEKLFVELFFPWGGHEHLQFLIGHQNNKKNRSVRYDFMKVHVYITSTRTKIVKFWFDSPLLDAKI